MDPPPTTDSQRWTCAPSRSPPTASRELLRPPVHLLGGLAQHRVDRDHVSAVPVAYIGEHALERRDLHLVHADRPRDRVAPELLDEVRASHDDAGLRAAEQLVAAERDEVRAVGERVGDGRLVRRHAVAAARAAPTRRRSRNGTPRLRASAARSRAGVLAREAHDAVVRGMDLEDRAGALGEGGAVVGDPRAVRRADLDELRAGRGHDVRDPELAADLDQLAARDEDLLALRERREARAGAPRRSCSRPARPRRR